MSEKDGPLLELARRLRSAGIPSLGLLKECLSEWEYYSSFVALVKEFLPEREQDILSRPTPQEQLMAFASRFEDRYFPLDDHLKLGDIDDYSEILWQIPVILLGMGYEDYHELSTYARPGIQLMSNLVASPYGDDERSALAEACLEHVPRELLQQIPEGGLQPAEHHRLLDGTRFEGLAHWADIIWKETGNFFLDSDYENLGYYGEYPEWDRETVEMLTQQWPQAELIHRKVMDLAKWLEEDPPAKFEELLNFILEKGGKDGVKGEKV